MKAKPENPVAVLPGGGEINAAQASLSVLKHDTGCPKCGKPLVLITPSLDAGSYFRHRPGEKHGQDA